MAVKYADRAGEAARLRACLLGLPLLGVGAYGLQYSLSDPSVFGVYVGFLSALAVWGWVELAFLTGVITGPNHETLPPNVEEPERFMRAWGTVAYHEIALLAVLTILLPASLGAENAFGLWTFVILYFARVSAKLNLYLGVPKIQIEFLPQALSHLQSHFRVQAMNWFFPISITGLSFALACWLERLYAAETAARIEGFALLAALTGLALFEHWMMVLPIPDERLWRWMLPRQPLVPGPKTQEDLKGGRHGL